MHSLMLITMKHLKISMCTQRKAQLHTNVIQCTLNSILALENDLLSTPTCMVNLTFLQLDQFVIILNSMCTYLDASVY